MITYEWDIKSIRAYPVLEGHDNVISVVEISCTGTKNGKQHTESGFTQIPIKLDSPLIPYEQVTKEQILNWAWVYINKNECEKIIEKRIDDMDKPVPVLVNLPWSV